jgi:hypothetical protein
MNPNNPRHPWSRLVAAARRAPDERDTAAPYGFATRVAALAFAQERSPVSLWERFSLRALAVACLLTGLTVATNYSAVTKLFVENETVTVVTVDDPVTELIDVVSS